MSDKWTFEVICSIRRERSLRASYWGMIISLSLVFVGCNKYSLHE